MVDMKKLKDEAMQRKHEHLKQQLGVKTSASAKIKKPKPSNKKSAQATRRKSGEASAHLAPPKRLKFKLSQRVIELILLLLAGFLLLKLFNPFG